MRDQHNNANDAQQRLSVSDWSLSNKLSLCSIIVSILSLLATIFVMIATTQISNNITKELGSNPELRIQKDNLTVSWDKQGHPVSFTSDQMYDLDTLEDGQLRIPSIYFTNIGNDVALNVDIDWHLMCNLNQLNQQIDAETTIEEFYSDGSVEIVSTYGSNSPLFVVNKLEDSISFIQAQRKEGISFPLSLLESVTFYCFQKFPSSGTGIDYSRSFKDSEMPTISISVSYENALDMLTTDNLDIRFRPIAYERKQDGSGYCRFEIVSYAADEE